MTTRLLAFVVVFVLALASICALVVVRMLRNRQLSDSSPRPHGHSRLLRNRHISAHRTRRAV
jgi:hypothetical protein